MIGALPPPIGSALKEAGDRVIRSAVTISLVDEARDGPFVFHRDLAAACKQAQLVGFDAVELFLPSPRGGRPGPGSGILLNDHGLALAAVGSGAGWLKHKLHLALADAQERSKAREYIRSLIHFAGGLHAPVIIGSMQGRSSPKVPHSTALGYLADALEDLGETAKGYGVPLLYEPLNRYETDLIHTLDAGAHLTHALASGNILLVADLFHMNIEESNSANAIRSVGRRIGHLHFADSNRRAAGFGQVDFVPIAEALHEVGYAGYASAEALPYPDSHAAAVQTMHTFQSYFRHG